MPRLSAVAVRLALGYLVAGVTIGSLLLAGAGGRWWPVLWLVRPWHVEFLLFGWTVQLAFGVAAWILPRTRARRRPRSAVVALVLLNVGLWMVSLGGTMAAEWLHLAGRVIEVAAMGAFAFHVWPRVRAIR